MIIFKKLFEPINIGNLVIKNRIAMAPMGIDYMVDPDGSLNQRVVDYYLERAKNGVGMIICACFHVEDQIVSIEKSAERIMDSGLGYLGELCDAAHSYGSKIFVQLTAGYGRVTMPELLKKKPVSASATNNFWNPDIICRELKINEIEKIVSAMGDAAEKLRIAGVDGIELHGHEGYLLDQFATSLWNRRTDQYGGSLKNRLRFSIDCLKEIRKRIGSDLAIQYRFGLKHYLKDTNSGALPGEIFHEVGRDIQEGLQMAQMLEEAGFDALHVDAGCYESWYWPHPPNYQKHGCMVEMAARVKEIVSIPVIAVGRLDLPELAEKTLSQGEADIVALGRGLLADPEWVSKVQKNRVEDIRPCLACYDGCWARYKGHRPVSCAVNPACGRERLYDLVPTRNPKKIVIIGGGVAGMEFARVADLRAHHVTLYEKETKLGGMVARASIPRFKRDLLRLIAWYENQLRKSSVELILGTEVTLNMLDKDKPDVVVVATGARPMVPDIPGLENDIVTIGINSLTEQHKIGEEVAIVGGGLVGCEIAIWLSQKGKKATLIEMLPKLMSGGVFVPYQVQLMTRDLLKSLGVRILTGTKVSEIFKDGVSIINSDLSAQKIRADTVVLAVGLKASDRLYQELSQKFAQIYAIGDCRKPQNIMLAVWDAYEISRSI